MKRVRLLAEALAMIGRLDDATALFYRLLGYGTHGLINTAVTLSELLEARDARFRAWS